MYNLSFFSHLPLVMKALADLEPIGTIRKVKRDKNKARIAKNSRKRNRK